MPVPHAWKMGLAGISEYFSETTGVFGCGTWYTRGGYIIFLGGEKIISR